MFTLADTVKPGSHYFTLSTEVRETSIKTMLKKSYEHDFVELGHRIVLIIRSTLIMIICLGMTANF